MSAESGEEPAPRIVLKLPKQAGPDVQPVIPEQAPPGKKTAAKRVRNPLNSTRALTSPALVKGKKSKAAVKGKTTIPTTQSRETHVW